MDYLRNTGANKHQRGPPGGTTHLGKPEPPGAFLVYAWLFCTVWYKYIPWDPYIKPADLAPPSLDVFNTYHADVMGYKKVTYLITKDIVQTNYGRHL